ncbi:MAG: twin-arginine translocase TatA/TatE family subunit [Deltaproteobacteria bacterium]|nr:twin-arginine translocase TatA/TatE family subunit [Deltaproteobacteria bacterium]
MVIGTGEWLLIGIILLLVFSASRMGQLGNVLGSFVHGFRQASRGQGVVDVQGKRLDEPGQPPRTPEA